MKKTLIYNGKRYAPVNAKNLRATASPGTNGYYQQQPNGVLLYTLDGNPGAFLVANHRQGFFAVTAGMTSSGIRYMHSTCSITEEWLGIDVLGYADSIEAVRSMQFIAEGATAAAAPVAACEPWNSAVA